MATISNDPFADLLTLQHDMDRLFSRFGAAPRRFDVGEYVWTPTTDVFRRGGDIVVRLDVPGVDPRAIRVSVSGNQLTVKGERRDTVQAGEGDYVLKETRTGGFERRVTMPEDMDATQVRARHRAGVLEVIVPQMALRPPEARPVHVADRPADIGDAATGPRGADAPEGGYTTAVQSPVPQRGEGAFPGERPAEPAASPEDKRRGFGGWLNRQGG